MTRPHLIDSAIFETSCSVSLDVDERAGLDRFIGSDLLRVIDEVLDEVERHAVDSDRVLRLDRLEIDLGETSRRQYRYDLPQKLREKLTLALDDIARTASLRTASTSQLVDEKSADASQLLYFLRHGYLPWYSRGMDAEKLETLLLDVLDTAPSSLAELLRENAGQASLTDRLKQQFSASTAERALRLLPTAGATPGSRDADIEAIRVQLVSGLISGDSAEIRAAWPDLYAAHANWIERTIRFHGQRQAVRRHLVAGLAPAQFDQLLALLEPTAHGLLQTTIDQAELFIAGGSAAGAGKAEYKARLREYALAYLLVESGRRFSELSYLESLLRQSAAAQHLSPSDLLERLLQKLEVSKRPETGELSRIIAGFADRIAADTPSAANAAGLAEAYRRLERIRVSLQSGHVGYPAASELVTDAGALVSDWPWLMLRLFRELQAERYDWRRALQSLPVDLLAGLVHASLRLKNQAAATDTDELAATIRGKVPEAGNRRTYYARILDRLIADELIDFEAILDDDATADKSIEASVPAAEVSTRVRDAGESDIAASLDNLSVMDEATRHRMLQCAELLTTASLSAGISLSIARLEALKWAFIVDYAADTGYLFNETHFARQYVDSLFLQVAAGERSAFRPALVRGLARDGLPSTRAMSERLAEILNLEKSVPVVGDESEDSNDEAAVLEDIHIANAGAVLLAPYLPRLFERLELIESGGFINREAAERAVHCVQFLVDGSLSSPEYRLVLNKLLCGVRPGLPICRGIELATAEKQQLEALLQAVIEHWTALGNTSIAGLRESFLQRDGRLQRSAEAWRLSVEGRSFDMLLDGLPWTYSTLRFAWMDRPIYVEWR